MRALNNVLNDRSRHLMRFLRHSPSAVAEIQGSPDYPDISGFVTFYQTDLGVLVSAQIIGLPKAESACDNRIFAFHIHSGTSCTGDENDYFADAKTHYNPSDCDHPYHAGDLPPLWGNNGYAFELFLTDRFTVNEVIGRVVIIHLKPDDFTTQPSGNSGQKIACGIIKKTGR